MASFNPIEALETSSLSQESFNFDFAGDFSDKNIDIDAGFSTSSDTSTWIYGNTARLTDDQYSNPDPSSLRFSDRAKTLSEGESFAVLDNDGEIWYCTIEESASRGHGDRFDGVIVSYFLAEQGELIDDYGSSISEHGFLAIDDTIIGNLEAFEDLDWFAVELDAGFTYQFTLEGDSLEDPVLSLYQANGDFVLSNDDADGLESETDSQVTFQAEVSGTYYLEASGLDDLTGSYTLNGTFYSIVDDNNDGLVDNVTNYQVYAGDDAVDITYRGRTVSDATSPQWDLTKAVYIDDSFELLLEGTNRKNGQFRGVTANSLVKFSIFASLVKLEHLHFN